MKTVKPIKLENIEDFNSTYKILSDKEQIITKRIDYIIKKIAEIFGGEVSWWGWSYENYKNDISLKPSNLDSKIIIFCGRAFTGPRWEWGAIIKDETWKFGSIFPKRWLTEDFEDELREGIKKYEMVVLEEEKNKQKEHLARKRKEEAVLKSIKQKLTSEELKVIGLGR